jgi:hypothetical protein
MLTSQGKHGVEGSLGPFIHTEWLKGWHVLLPRMLEQSSFHSIVTEKGKSTQVNLFMEAHVSSKCFSAPLLADKLTIYC